MVKVGIILTLLLIGCAEKKTSLKIKGSDTEVNLVANLAEVYTSGKVTSYISVSGGGSGLGIASLLNGQTDIANSSRELNDEEKALFQRKGVQVDSFVFAEDAIAFVVNSKLPLDSLTTDQLSLILNGTTKEWSTLTSSPYEITIYGRQSNSGTYDFIRKLLKIRFSLSAREMNGNAQILEAVKADPSGIGYVGAGYVMNKNGLQSDQIKILKISHLKGKAYSPLDSSAVFNHQYFFRRHLYQFIRKNSSPESRKFIAFEQSLKGIAMIRQAGYYPINDRSNYAQ